MIAWLVACGPRIDVGPVPAEQWMAPVTVIAEPTTGTPELHLLALVRAGSGFDPIGREGLAWLVAHAVAESGVRATVDTEWVRFELTCPRGPDPDCIEDFSRSLTSLELGRWDALRSEALAVPREPLDTLRLHLFEGHRTGHPLAGWPEVVPSLTEDEARRFFETHYRRSTMLAGVAGDDAERWGSVLGEALLAVPAGAPADDAWMRPPRREARTLLVVPNAGADEPPVVAFGQVLDTEADDPAIPLLRSAVRGLEEALRDELAGATVHVRLEPGATGLRRTVSIVGEVRAEGADAPLTTVLAALDAWPGEPVDPGGPTTASAETPPQRLLRRLVRHVAPRAAPASEEESPSVGRLVPSHRWQLVVHGDPGVTTGLGLEQVHRVGPTASPKLP